MILVDTSVLIEYFRGNDSGPAKAFQTVLDAGLPFAITPQIYQEVLQGARDEREFRILREYLETQTFLLPADNRTSYAAAAHLYYSCRKKGITINSTIDCLIARTAIEHNVQLLYHDSDFERIASVYPRLKIFRC